MGNVSRYFQGEVVCTVGSCQAEVDKAIGAPLCEYHAKLVFVKVANIYGMALPTKSKARPVAHVPVGTIYIVQHGNRVKIGFTRTLKRRMKEVPHDKILATFPGTLETEQKLHARFSDIRTVGEWFEATPELIKFTDAINAEQAA